MYKKEHTIKDGEARAFNSYAIQRSYKNKKTGKTEYSDSFSGTDLLRLAAMAQAAFRAHDLKQCDAGGSEGFCVPMIVIWEVICLLQLAETIWLLAQIDLYSSEK